MYALCAVLLPATLSARSDPVILTAICGQDGQVHLTFKDGRQVAVPWLESQSGCDDVKLAQDHLSAGWLVLERDLGGTSPLATGVTVFTANHVVRHFGDGQVVWDWRFEGNHGVVLSTNSAHGIQTEKQHYVLYDIATGKMLRRWDGAHGGKRPRWAAGLRF